MINSVNFNTNIAQSRQKTDAPVTQPSFEGNSEMSPEISSAYRAYGQSMINKPFEQLSFKECIQQLQKQGKIIGKDYKLEKNGNSATAIYLLNKNGQETKRMLFQNDGKIGCWEDFKYANGKKVKEIFHSSDGRIPNYLDYYYNDEIPQEAFTKDKLTYDTTPEQHIEYLNKNNINYKIEKNGEDDSNRSIFITEFDKNNKKIQTTYYYGKDKFGQKYQKLSRSIYDSNEAEVKRIELEKDSTEVCTYLEKWGKGHSYPCTDVPQETFTKEHITAETTADEYIRYLNENNKKFEVHEKDDCISISEFDNYGNEIQSTGFERNKAKFAPDDSIIMREEYLPNGNRKRIEFSKNDTYVTKFSYD